MPVAFGSYIMYYTKIILTHHLAQSYMQHVAFISRLLHRVFLDPAHTIRHQYFLTTLAVFTFLLWSIWTASPEKTLINSS